jgi:hypothetical protein
MEELTGSVVFGFLGGFVLWIPSFSAGPIADSRVAGAVAVVSSLVGMVLLLVRHGRRMAEPVRISPTLAAPYSGELGQIPGLVVREVGVDAEIPAATVEDLRELTRAA